MISMTLLKGPIDLKTSILSKIPKLVNDWLQERPENIAFYGECRRLPGQHIEEFSGNSPLSCLPQKLVIGSNGFGDTTEVVLIRESICSILFPEKKFSVRVQNPHQYNLFVAVAVLTVRSF